MKLKLLYWCSYVSDCPADLEITTDELILTVEDHPEVEQDIEAAKHLFMRHRLTDDLNSDLQHGPEEIARETAEFMAEDGFCAWASGYFRVQDVNLNHIETGYTDAIDEVYYQLPDWARSAIEKSINKGQLT